MAAILGKFVLIIALLGQFILTPAMAMPSALMSLMHGGLMEMALDQGDMRDMRLAQKMNPEMAPSTHAVTQALTQASAKHETGMQMSHQGKPCKMSGDGSLVDCEALCAAMGPGDCMTHCASTLGNLSAAVPSLTIQPLSGPIVISGWSLQTADLTPLSPPPIG
ncbi:hypothetical protein [Shewanella sp. KCT]|uniref:hypothetical protein n=1 Tax=Shewanella sp. KCT TaxID=2569535 RepID=UPI001183CA60|nr:hypothetical protein [Shewanella sp. KCT]